MSACAIWKLSIPDIMRSVAFLITRRRTGNKPPVIGKMYESHASSQSVSLSSQLAIHLSHQRTIMSTPFVCWRASSTADNRPTIHIISIATVLVPNKTHRQRTVLIIHRPGYAQTLVLHHAIIWITWLTLRSTQIRNSCYSRCSATEYFLTKHGLALSTNPSVQTKSIQYECLTLNDISSKCLIHVN